MSAVITLTTDFGFGGSYVAQMKGTILSVNPSVTLVDVTHNVAPRDIAEASYLVGEAHRHFPKGSIHLVVVDPGVGTERRAVILATPQASFVAPDNGCLSQVLGDGAALGEGSAAFSISNSSYYRHPVSNTFHGRDIFGPVAGHLSLGVPPEEFGEPLTSLAVLPPDRPEPTPDGGLAGRIVHADSFGNLITNIRQADLPADTSSLSFEVAGHTIEHLSGTYADEAAGLLALIGSGGRLEIAVAGGNASDLLKANVGDSITVHQTK